MQRALEALTVDDSQPRSPATKVTRRTIILGLTAAIVLSIVVVAANLQSARANSATWDEPLYMFLGRQAALGQRRS